MFFTCFLLDSFVIYMHVHVYFNKGKKDAPICFKDLLGQLSQSDLQSEMNPMEKVGNPCEM